tara:strand:+ start:311 stop:550 length:240 start_codon:yes stop_codon:yes gene_type:complete
VVTAVVVLVEDVVALVEMQPQTLVVAVVVLVKVAMQMVATVVLVLWLSDTTLQLDYQGQETSRYNQPIQPLQRCLQQQI